MPGLTLRESIDELAALIEAGCLPNGRDSRVLLAAAQRWAAAHDAMASRIKPAHGYGCAIYYGGACSCALSVLEQSL
jgi:hypothetical protein